MHSAERLADLQKQLDAILEERITDLAAAIRACQEVTAQIATTTLEIRRQEALREELSGEAGRLESENARSSDELAALRADVERLQTERDVLVTRLDGLSHAMKA